MVFLVVGIALLVMKFAEYGPVSDWPWWTVLTPFALTLLWWWYADASGFNKRREMERMEDRKAERRYGLLERLGLKDRYGRRRSSKKADRAHAARQREIDKIEGKRAEQRAKQRDSILRSRFDAEQSITRPSQAGSLRASNEMAKAGSARGRTTSAPPVQGSKAASSGAESRASGVGDLPGARYSGFAETVPAEPNPKAKG
jgi:small Trp-rich protein